MDSSCERSQLKNENIVLRDENIILMGKLKLFTIRLEDLLFELKQEMCTLSSSMHSRIKVFLDNCSGEYNTEMGDKKPVYFGDFEQQDRELGFLNINITGRSSSTGTNTSQGSLNTVGERTKSMNLSTDGYPSIGTQTDNLSTDCLLIRTVTRPGTLSIGSDIHMQPNSLTTCDGTQYETSNCGASSRSVLSELSGSSNSGLRSLSVIDVDGIVSHLLHSDDDSEESSSDQCDVCEDVTTHSEDIKLHKERCDFTSTSQKEESPKSQLVHNYQCEECKYSAADVYKLKRHINSRHNKTPENNYLKYL